MNFDLDINNYKAKELIEMFELPNNYDQNILTINETKLKDSIINNKEINKETKTKTINFIVEAKNILLANVNQQGGQQDLADFAVNLYNTAYDLKSVKIQDPSEHMLQVRPDKPYLSSYPTEYFPGVINPLKRKLNRQFLNIDTRFRENYYSSSSTNYSMTLPIHINDIISMQLISLELPTSYYAISKQFGNNFFYLTVGTTTTIVTIQDGNYTATAIVSYLNSIMTTLGGAFANVTFNVNLDSNGNGSNQIIISINPALNLTLSLNFQASISGIEDRNTPLPLKLGWKLGFRNGIYEGNTTYVSEGVVDLSGPRYLYLAIDDHNNNVNNGFYSAFNSSILNKNILARIPMSSPNFTIFTENNFNVLTYPRVYFGPVNIQNLSIQLLDEYGRVVDLNNMDYSFCLTFQTAYDV
jgi:hypothetical protein